MIEAQANFGSENDVFGYVKFAQKESGGYVSVDIHIIGLSDGKHGIHIHERAENGRIIKGHFSIREAWSPENDSGIPHGHEPGIRHTGDLCNNIKSVAGHARYQYTDKLISLIAGDPANVIGMFVVIHQDEDDGGHYHRYTDQNLQIQSRISGNSGKHIAHAQITIY